MNVRSNRPAGPENRSKKGRKEENTLKGQTKKSKSNGDEKRLHRALPSLEILF